MTETTWGVASDGAPQTLKGLGRPSPGRTRSHPSALRAPGRRYVRRFAHQFHRPSVSAGRRGWSRVTGAALRPLCIAHRWSGQCQPGPLDSEPREQAWNPSCACRHRVLGPEGSASLCPLLPGGLLPVGPPISQSDPEPSPLTLPWPPRCFAKCPMGCLLPSAGAPTAPAGSRAMILGDRRGGGMRCGSESRWRSWWPGWVAGAPVWPCSPAQAGPHRLSLPHLWPLMPSFSPVAGLLGKHASAPDGHQAPCWPRRQRDEMPVPALAVPAVWRGAHRYLRPSRFLLRCK